MVQGRLTLKIWDPEALLPSLLLLERMRTFSSDVTSAAQRSIENRLEQTIDDIQPSFQIWVDSFLKEDLVSLQAFSSTEQDSAFWVRTSQCDLTDIGRSDRFFVRREGDAALDTDSD